MDKNILSNVNNIDFWAEMIEWKLGFVGASPMGD